MGSFQTFSSRQNCARMTAICARVAAPLPEKVSVVPSLPSSALTSPAANAAGTSAAQPRLTHRDLNIQPGDTVLFTRGSLIRGALGNVQGTEGNPVTYGAYGEGENPAFSGSVDVSREENWEAVPGSPNVWRCLGPLTTQVCNFVFNNAFGGALKWEREALSARGDWRDSAFGQ